jgi:hypothetical protein
MKSRGGRKVFQPTVGEGPPAPENPHLGTGGAGGAALGADGDGVSRARPLSADEVIHADVPPEELNEPLFMLSDLEAMAAPPYLILLGRKLFDTGRHSASI